MKMHCNNNRRVLVVSHQEYESARLLLSYGLRETAKWAAPPPAVAAAGTAASTASGSGAGGVSGARTSGETAPDVAALAPERVTDVCWWRLQRLKLLQQYDRLELSMVSGGRALPR